MSNNIGLRTGQTLNGMVKSYNRKGFGFIMCQAIDQDIYFSRESLHPQLQTSDLAGENVIFEVHRFPDGKLQARNLRAVGDVSDFKGDRSSYAYAAKGSFGFQYTPRGPGREDEDRTRDWNCDGCGERNFVKRFECFKCKRQRPRDDDGEVPAGRPPSPEPVQGRTLSPHAGSRAMREALRKKLAGGGSSPSRSRGAKRKGSKRKRKDSSESSSSSSSSSSRRKKHKSKAKAASRSRSGSRSRRVSSSGSRERKKNNFASATIPPAPGALSTKEPANPEIEKAKAEVLETLMKLKGMEPRDARVREWRTLLRQWHPDKNPDRVEVATAVFQFLQKAKLLIDA